jgi:phosphoenolpyruvate carboxylase
MDQALIFCAGSEQTRTQCRLMLPGWYGFGTAVNNWVIAHPVPETLL